MSECTYAILYMRPDGWWIAGEGWESYQSARQAADDHFADHPHTYGDGYKVCVVGKKPYLEAKALEEREAL